MYLIGTFKRDYFGFSDNDNPMSLVGIVDVMTKERLAQASQDEDYQIIDLISRTYFDPKQNKWVKIENFDT